MNISHNMGYCEVGQFSRQCFFFFFFLKRWVTKSAPSNTHTMVAHEKLNAFLNSYEIETLSTVLASGWHMSSCTTLTQNEPKIPYRWKVSESSAMNRLMQRMAEIPRKVPIRMYAITMSKACISSNW